MTLTTTYHDGEHTIRRDVPLLPQTRFNTIETSRKNDCRCCLYYLGRIRRDNKTYHVCNMDICPAEAVGYDAREITFTDLQEVIA